MIDKKPDAQGYGWIMPLTKIEPVEIQGVRHNAKANKVWVGFWNDDDIVLI